VAVEVDPDKAAGDAALVARVGTAVGRAHGVDGCLLTGDRVVDCLEFLILPVKLWWRGVDGLLLIIDIS
jgi:hypothetical protein